ncbi:MAG: thioesterase family protein [Porticoccaceae bacterium]|nr:thioesterase family protein [Porticoccaceae bacterium]
MPKKIIAVPATFLFSTTIEVQKSDVNMGDHLAAEQVLRIANVVQRSYVKHLGYKDSVNLEDGGLIMAYSELAFLAEAMCGDQLKFELAIGNMGDKSFDYVHRVTNLTQGGEVARVLNTMVFFDYSVRKVGSLPETLKNRLLGNV